MSTWVFIVKDLISHLLCVNPNERYTIDQFLEHPWIKAGEVKPSEAASSTEPAVAIDSPDVTAPENKLLSGVAAMTPEYGSNKAPYKRRAENPLSPGIGLKEVFDVSNAVHRMEEESRRRHQNSSLHPADAHNTASRQRQAFMSQLNEEDEDDDHSSYSDASGSMTSDDEDVASNLNNIKISVDHAQDETSEEEKKAQELKSMLQQQQQEYQKAQGEIAAEHHQKYLKQQQTGQAIPGQHTLPTSNTLSTAARGNQVGPLSASTSASTVGSTSTTSTTRRRRAGFELNLNHATLLNRRAKQQQPGDDEPPQSQETPVLAL